MARVTIVNKFGRIVGWNNITIRVLGRDLEGVTELSYDDTIAKEIAHGSGRFPIGVTEGNYTAKASITLYKEEVISLQKSLLPAMLIQDIPPFPMIVEYEYKGSIYKEIVPLCEFTNNKVDAKNGEGKIVTTFELLVGGVINWNA